ncbi:hypothetical protein PTKIN_Ptkin11bG0122600 [Pterospermum kingtungense]
MNVLVWNYQSAISKEFLRVLKDLLRQYKPILLALLEPRFSDYQADEICNNLGFKEWIRMEAIGFSGGIWVFWNSSLVIEVVQTNP